MNKYRLLRWLPRGRTWVFLLPFTWLLLFFLLPFSLVLKISFSSAAIAIPPYQPLVEYANDSLTFVVNLANYLFLFSDSLYVSAYWGSIKMAAGAMFLCLLIGYPMAYAMSKAKPSTQLVLLLLVLMPSWTSFLIRVYAWMGILGHQGVLNQLLLSLNLMFHALAQGILGHQGVLNQLLLSLNLIDEPLAQIWAPAHHLLSLNLIDEPLRIMNTNIAVMIGLVYAYLPFMVLPLYANLIRLDRTLLEAAADLGSRQLSTFWRITLPLSKNGIIAGCMLVFIPAVGEFVVPELLGGPDTLMIGKILWQEFFSNRDWPVASALAMIMLLLLLVPIILFHRFQAKELEKNV
ncbi:ABC transporter permease subunit [Marinospirillum sp.]|uniref:ABC transporter permease subunit n=1 Tax=Marinospirillum sp. TaxID=2183934 RepID=UPI003A854C70